MSDIKSDLDRAAREIRQRGISGWGNTCEEAAQHIRELEAENADLRKVAHCRYPKCVDYSEDQRGRCVDWLMGDCPGPPDEEPPR